MFKRASVLFVAMAAIFVLAKVVHAQDTTPPSVPQGVSAYLTESGQIYISWGASTDNVGVEGYYVYRDGQLVANTPGLLFYTDNAPAGTHTYTVAAYDQSGNVSEQSAPTSPPITVVADTIPPTAPTDLTLSPSSSSVILSWNPSTDNVGVIGYYIYRNGQELILSSTVAGTTYTDTGLTPGVTYTYQVGAYDAAGNITRSSPESVMTIFDVTPPSAPRSLIAKTISSDEIDLAWSAATDNISVAGYSIYQNNNYLTTVDSSTLTYDDTGLSPNTLYSYQVSAYDEVGNSSQLSFPADATTMPPDLTPPSIPNGIHAVSPSTSEIDLSWLPSTDNVGVVGYYVYRDGTEITTTASTTYDDLGLATDTTHEYAVMAYDAAGNISPQTSIAATTLTTNPVVPVNVTSTGQNPQPPIVGPTQPSSPASPPNSFVFTTMLYFGLRGAAVQNLQIVLIGQGDLGAGYDTGYFGSLTQKAVQEFQCSEGIVCSGSTWTTGWGLVGVRTRRALNAL